ncbi:MAG: ATP-binding protein [Candidatus Pelethousia sp.]|nr:ATP-binding protein [Candidatus Pelethousia sp.]
MKQLLILSGKGGTGKTTIASAFIRLAGAKAYADCDVDAPNLHLVMEQSRNPQRTNYYGLPKAQIDGEACVKCGNCKDVCRFGAISSKGRSFQADPFACEGCGVCAAFCPAGAISLKPAVAGEKILYAGAEAVFSTARLKMGSGTSGMLVTEVKKQMRAAAPREAELAIIDGSPGIGCPVIASLSGVDMVLIVAEPSISGISDMTRIIKTADMFHTKIGVCINKYDTSPANSEKIKEFCRERSIPLVGEIPFDPEAVKAINSGKTIVDVACVCGSAVKAVYQNTRELLFKEGEDLTP